MDGDFAALPISAEDSAVAFEPGESIAAAVLAISAGADGFATKNASYAEAVDAADRGAAADDADTVHADKNNAESNDRSTTEKVSLLASLHSSLRRAAHTSDALRRDAMQRARKVRP